MRDSCGPGPSVAVPDKLKKFVGMIVLVCVQIAVFGAPTPLIAGVWVRSKDSVYSQLTYGLFFSESHFDEHGTARSRADGAFIGNTSAVLDSGRYLEHVLSSYVEYGVGSNLELFGSVPLKFSVNRWTFDVGSNPDIIQHNEGIGDLLVGMRRGQVGSGWAYAFSGAIVCPLYDNSPAELNMGVSNLDFYDDKPPLGEGTMELLLNGSGGLSFSEISGWIEATVGVRIRDRGFATGVPGMVKFGWTARPWLVFMASSSYLLTIDNGSQPDFFRDAFGKSPLVIDRQHFIKAALDTMAIIHPKGAGAKARTVGITLGASSVPWGYRTAQGFESHIGLVVQR